jgi:hypothetical protein
MKVFDMDKNHGEPGGPSFKECNDVCGPLEKP